MGQGMINIQTKYGKEITFRNIDADVYQIDNNHFHIQGDEELIRNYLTGLLNESDIDELFKGE